VKMPADIHASEGVCPQTVLCGFGSLSSLWNPRLREAATTLSVSVGQSSGNIKSNKGRRYKK